MHLSGSQVRHVAVEHGIPWLAGPLVAVLLVGGVLYDRRPVIEIESLHGRAVPPLVQEAGTLTIEWSAYRLRTCGTLVAREVVDAANVVFRLDQESGPRSNALGFDIWRMTIPVPPSAAWGTARYRSTITYQCGITHGWFPVTVQSPEVPFEIVPLPQKRIEELRG